MADNGYETGRGLSRRRFLKLAGVAAMGAAGAPWLIDPARAQVRTSARVVIAGAGAGGLAMASRLSRLLDGARITIVDSREIHWYQPGFTLIAGGVWAPDRVTTPNSAFMPGGVEWIKADIAEFDPDGNRVVTDQGQTVRYDYLVVATGLELDYGDIEGMERSLIGQHGIGSVYAGPQHAAATWATMQAFVEGGGLGIFGRPPGGIKCAGAPLKMTLLTDYHLREAGRRGRAELIYAAHNDALFGVAPVNERVTEMFGSRGIEPQYSHVLKAVDPGRRTATFDTPDGDATLDYDFLHVVPPMSPPDPVTNSALAWQEGPFSDKGWLEVDQYTMRHRRYPNVFGIGDVNGIPKGKTAASVKAQAPVVAGNLVRVIEDREPTHRYNGYTSCPLVTAVGQAMLVEFDYEGNLIPSFPFLDPLEPSWVPWMMEELMLRPAYDAVLRGRI
ncbi:NAD(P)/FAD-dependent oxidoreductase [Ectothiorhodospiraceae bacterium WFHF3C12]|nr:NAD(P)/FAD-dependent oxidoreductase [Ectothiorhodospiraceae bacterium WFHF3C12]